MDAYRVVRRLRLLATLGLVFAGLAATGAAGATTQSCQNWDGQPPDEGTFSNDLLGVAATSSCDAWAVGEYFDGNEEQTLIERWGGTAWKIQPSPDQGSSGDDNVLNGVVAISPTDVWAVGYYFNGTADQTLIEHWNGTVWEVVPSPNLGTSTSFNELQGVAAVSADNVWAVGQGAGKALVEHWNGTAWKVQSTPRPTSSGGRYLRTRPVIGLDGVAGGGRQLLHEPHEPGADADRALERQGVERLAESEPGGEHQRAPRGRRHLSHKRLGGGRIRRSAAGSDAGRALERQGLEDRVEPQPRREWP